MKKLLPILCIFLAPILAKTQNSNYHPFPNSYAVWNFNYSMQCFQNGTGDENYSIVLNGDTLINNINYKQLNIPFVESFTTGTCDWVTTGYKGAIREDSLNRKVYIVPPNDSIEQLLYDFTLDIGDTVKGYLSPSGSDVVQSIDSVLIGNNYRKKWNINSCYNISIIEGLGSTYGLIEPSPGCITDYADFSLLCFQNGQINFPSSSNCNIITSINENNRITNSVKVYPNPTSDYIKIDLNGFTGYDKIFNLNNIEGKIVMNNKIKNTQETLELSISNLPNGLYFYHIKDKNTSIASGKIIIER